MRFSTPFRGLLNFLKSTYGLIRKILLTILNRLEKFGSSILNLIHKNTHENIRVRIRVRIHFWDTEGYRHEDFFFDNLDAAIEFAKNSSYKHIKVYNEHGVVVYDPGDCQDTYA